MGITAKVYNKLLDADFSGAVKKQAGRRFRGVLNLFPIDDRGLRVRGVLRFIEVGVNKLGAQICSEVLHYEASGALDIVLGEVNSSI